MEGTRLEELKMEIVKILGGDDVQVDVPLADLGIDSLNVVELVMVCQELYPTVVQFENIQIDQHTTLREVDQQLISLSVDPKLIEKARQASA